MRVLIAPFEVAGFGNALVQGLRAEGAEARMLELADHPFRYANSEPDWAAARLLRRLRAWRTRGRGRVLRALLVMLPELVGRLACLARALARYDAFVWLTGRSLLPGGIDMPLLRLFGKRQLCVFLGTDARPPYLSGLYVKEETTPGALRRIERMTRLTALRLHWCERWCDHTVNHPPTAQLQRRAYLDFVTMGFPTPPLARSPGSNPGERARDAPLRVVHAPSRPRQKGSALVRTTIAALQAEGFAVEYREYTGIDNATLLGHIAHADLVIDELYSDTPLGGLGREAAALGVPCVVCGYASDVLEQVPGFRDFPRRWFALPEEFPHRLRELVTDASARRDLADAQRDFVARHWTPEVVGARYRRLLQGDIDPAWEVKPASCDYFLGWGAEREALREFLRVYIRARGCNALYLDNDPVLRERIREFAGAPEGTRT